MTEPRQEEQGAKANSSSLYGKPPRLRRGGFTEREGFEPSIQVLARITV